MGYRISCHRPDWKSRAGCSHPCFKCADWGSTGYVSYWGLIRGGGEISEGYSDLKYGYKGGKG